MRRDARERHGRAEDDTGTHHSRRDRVGVATKIPRPATQKPTRARRLDHGGARIEQTLALCAHRRAQWRVLWLCAGVTRSEKKVGRETKTPFVSLPLLAMTNLGNPFRGHVSFPDTRSGTPRPHGRPRMTDAGMPDAGVTAGEAPLPVGTLVRVRLL